MQSIVLFVLKLKLFVALLSKLDMHLVLAWYHSYGCSGSVGQWTALIKNTKNLLKGLAMLNCL